MLHVEIGKVLNYRISDSLKYSLTKIYLYATKVCVYTKKSSKNNDEI